MNNQNPQDHNHSHFWPGFLAGASVGIAGIYFFGTKKGRKNLQNVLDLTENLEETLEKTFGEVREDYTEELAGSKAKGRRKKAEQGSIVDEKESLLHLIIKTVASYVQNSQTKSASN